MGLFGHDGDARRGTGCSGRTMIALFIVLAAFTTYFFRRQENPVTHEMQYVALTPAQEVALGLRSAPEMAREMGGIVPRSDPRAQLVQRVGHYLVEHSIARTGPWQYDFHLLADGRTINAFALPGGQIFMTLGLLQKLNNEAEVAGVLGHECGHVIERHSAEQMAKAQRDNMLVVATGIGASDDRGDGRWAAAAAAVAAQMAQLRYSRSDESEADQWGLRIMTEAGYDPRGMMQVMEVLADADRGRHPPEFLQTHPYPEHRLDTIRQWIDQRYPDGVPSHLVRSHHLVGETIFSGE